MRVSQVLYTGYRHDKNTMQKVTILKIW